MSQPAAFRPLLAVSPYPGRPDGDVQPLQAAGRFALVEADLKAQIRAAGGSLQRYSITDRGCDQAPLTLTATWQVETRQSEQTLPGPQPDRGRQAVSHADARQQAQGLSHQILNGPGRDALASLFSTPTPPVPLGTVEEVTLPVGGAFATVHDCIRCHTGFVRCSICGGSGRRQVTVTDTGSNGQSQTRTEQRACSTCHGSGQVTCTACDGTARQTTVIQVSTVAIPRYHHTVSGPASPRITALLDGADTRDVIALFVFSPHRTAAQGGSTLTVTYTATAEVSFAEVESLHPKTWMVYAAGPDCRYLNPPPVLDDLIAPQMLRVEETLRQSRSRRLAVFTQLLALPLYDAALRLHAEEPGYPAADKFGVAAHHLISADLAERAGTALFRLVEGICPRYSGLPWGVATAAAAPAVLLAAALPVSPLAGAATLAAALAMVLGGGLAVWLTGQRRSAVAVQYRPPRQDWKPALLAAVLLGGVTLWGASGAASAISAATAVQTAAAPLLQPLSGILPQKAGGR